MSDIYVVVCANDKAHPRWGVDPDGPLVFETYTKEATREVAEKRAAAMSVYGACRIARLIFVDEQPAAGDAGITTRDSKGSIAP